MSASRRMDLAGRGLAIATVLVAGCFAQPDLSQITCKTDQQCAPGYRCDLSRNKCSQITDGAAIQDVPDVRPETADSPGDGSVGADQASPGDVGNADRLIVVSETGGGLEASVAVEGGGAVDGLIPDLPEAGDGPTRDLASDGPTDAVPDAPSALPEARSDIGADRAADLALPADARTPDAPDLGPDVGPDLGRDAGPDLGPDSPAGGAIGDSCSKPSDCANGNCVDGVCCDSPCTGVCQSCALDLSRGVCSLVNGSPAPGHGSCKGSGTCGGRCNGKSAACYYPWDETSCGAATCSPENGSATSERTCDGKGGCGSGTVTQCGDYACGTSACLTSCGSVGDCVTGAVCVSGGVCVPCAVGETVCGNTCVNTDSDAHNCGRCEQSCGGNAACSNGRCQQTSMVSSLPSNAGYDVGPDGLFYTSNGTVYGCTQTSCSGTNQRQLGGGFAATSDLVLTRGTSPNQVVFYGSQSQPYYGLYACPVTTGCPSGLTPIVSYGPQTQWSLRGFQTNGGDVYYMNAGVVTALYHCSGTSSSCTQTVGGGPGTAHVPSVEGTLDFARAFVTDAMYVYFLESIDTNQNFSLDRCANNTSCATPDVLVPSIFAPTILVAHNGRLYWSQSKSGDPIVQCDLPGCATQTNFLVATVGAVLGMAVDSSGLYWMTTSGIYACPLTGCPGAGPTVITSSVPDASKELRVQDSSIYWLTPGTGADGVVYRIAKP